MVLDFGVEVITGVLSSDILRKIEGSDGLTFVVSKGEESGINVYLFTAFFSVLAGVGGGFFGFEHRLQMAREKRMFGYFDQVRERAVQNLLRAVTKEVFRSAIPAEYVSLAIE
jgi:hypothetical protein